MSSNSSPDEQNSSVPNSQGPPQTVPSGKRAVNARRAASSARSDPASSPPAPTRPGLTPTQPRARRSSIQVPAQDGGASSNTDSIHPEGHEEVDAEIETPTRKPTRRARPKPPKLAWMGASSPLRQTMAPGSDVSSDRSEISTVRPPLGSAHTSPETMERTGRGHRPNIAERSVSEPVTPGKRLSGFQLDGDIAQLIKDGPRRDKGKEKENGSIYLYKVKPRGSEVWLVKIGRTQKPTEERLGQIKWGCGHLEVEEHTRAIARDVPFHGFAEKLIHKELSNYQHHWLCDCGTRHREYFLVSEGIAIKSFERWRDFCQEMPWDQHGRLLPTWTRRLQNRARFKGGEREFDHHEFARRWTAFTVPTPFERLLSDAIRVWRLWFPNRWLVVSLAELLTIVCISRQSFWTSIWTTIIVSLILVDLVVTENMHTTAYIFELMEGGLQSVSLRQKPSGDNTVAGNQSPASESSPESAPGRQDSREAAFEERGSSSPASSHSRIDMRQAMADDKRNNGRIFTDDEDDWDIY